MFNPFSHRHFHRAAGAAGRAMFISSNGKNAKAGTPTVDDIKGAKPLDGTVPQTGKNPANDGSFVSVPDDYGELKEIIIGI